MILFEKKGSIGTKESVEESRVNSLNTFQESIRRGVDRLIRRDSHYRAAKAFYRGRIKRARSRPGKEKEKRELYDESVQ